MKKILALESWNRKEHFEFFSQFEEPFFGLVTKIDCTKAYQFCKETGHSFFIYYLHKILKAVNEVENFRYRIEDNRVVIYNQVDASATITRADHTFGFSYIEFAQEFSTFNQIAKTEIQRIQETTGLFTRQFDMENLIHFSAIPWVDFSHLSHARSFTFPDSCPKISVGKMIEENGQGNFSVSVHAHHGLMDGYHVGLFFEKLQSYLNHN